MNVKQALETTEKQETALLLGSYGQGNKDICVEHLEELELLTKTFGVESQEKIAYPLKKPEASTYIGKGKLEEMVELADKLAVDIIIFDEELTPVQQRNLEKAFQRPVMERTEIILGVFAKRAQTKEARLQIELAQAQYQLPRLKRMWTHLSRQRGGANYLKGEGEKQIEIDRRLLRRRIDVLKQNLKEVKRTRDMQRRHRIRTGIPTFAIIGYTNAGKSTLLNALTEAGVLTEDKLFATLDTTTRKFLLPNNEEVLLIDTVGFIRKIPHTLVAAFKSTLEESVEADILIHLIDVSHPMAYEHAEATIEVLKELKAHKKPMICVLNKVDKPLKQSQIDRMRTLFPKTVQVSALNKTGFDNLIELMMQELSSQRERITLKIPQKEYGLVNQLLSTSHLIEQNFEDNDVFLTIDCPKQIVGQVKKYLIKH